jgi:hypothetical protein
LTIWSNRRFHYRQYPQRYTPGLTARFDAAFAMSEYHARQMPPFALNKAIYTCFTPGLHLLCTCFTRFDAAFAMSEYHARQMPPFALNKVPLTYV